MFLINQKKDKMFNLNKVCQIQLSDKDIVIHTDDGMGHIVGTFKDEECAELAFKDILQNMQKEAKGIYV